MTENADLQSRVVELQSRHQVKGSVLVYDIFVAPVILCDGSAHSSGCVVNGIIISVCRVLRESSSLWFLLCRPRTRGLAEAQQQLRQMVSVKSFLVASEIVLMSLFLAAGGTATIQ